MGIAYDTPGMSGQTSDSKLGGGPVVIMMDAQVLRTKVCASILKM